MEQIKRFADKHCPMCNSEDEEVLETEWDGTSFSGTLQCSCCGFKYTIVYSMTYDGFYAGEAVWDKDGNREGA